MYLCQRVPTWTLIVAYCVGTKAGNGERRIGQVGRDSLIGRDGG